MLAPLDGSDWDNSPATGDFYFQASDGLVTLPAAGYDYDIDWTPMSAGLAPAGIAASFAALARMSAATCGNERAPHIAFAHAGYGAALDEPKRMSYKARDAVVPNSENAGEEEWF